MGKDERVYWMTFIYVVINFWGEYDDYTEVNVKAFYKESDALRFISEQKRPSEYKIDKIELV